MDLRCVVRPDGRQSTLLARLEEAQLGVGEHCAILPLNCDWTCWRCYWRGLVARRMWCRRADIRRVSRHYGGVIGGRVPGAFVCGSRNGRLRRRICGRLQRPWKAETARTRRMV